MSPFQLRFLSGKRNRIKEHAMPDKQKRLLLFEENFSTMCSLKQYLEEEHGWFVELTAEESILQRLAHERFDLVVLDVMIHGTSLDSTGQEIRNVHFEDTPWLETGLEFLRRLRHGEFSQDAERGTSPDVPVIILSALPEPTIVNALREDVSVQGYVEKPFKLDAIVSRFKALLQES
jgi:CheY-like chemotaxis protein